MRHLNGRRKLNRTTSHRLAMLRNMVTSFLRVGYIRTTDSKGREVQRIAERVITLSRHATLDSAEASADAVALGARRLHRIRMARRWVRDRKVLQVIFSEYGPRFASRNGGYTRLTKLGFRPGDCTGMVMLSLVDDGLTSPVNPVNIS